ncbi:hypothetical protein TRIATDRAFT_285651 [Trichoderma atroviride IMI 206040]|uniref:Nephrocystin 3-like N-terminal domain-containing protein n=1 Tax=Hypocrea atroviridis (strain ATCC 20476 / IMI 206040) TaxID=452589 RepID=G9P3L5_HYPAI|nr:uncharacterized protein TRIATDRAFT_285651 [Trichoderma atroviride IMI 206040]EHK42973.1 hypothetical protein TRIATDRAFT_285651 [Trichoderma atroviride IMI 206040]
MAPTQSKVYRLRGIPEHLDRLGVTQLVSTFVPGGDLRDVIVTSLALSCEVWTVSRSKVATLSFQKLPDVVSKDPTAGEWPLRVLALAKPLLLDDTFFGLCPLNDVPEHQHKYDCIVMSGLASHPMGSWQPHGEDKSFMWIRDTLPLLVPNVKFILYGYDTTLAESKSFQSVSDLASSFISTLQQGGWTSTGHRQLLFFAHSLGGVVLKESFRMLADSGVMDELILTRTKGAIFFGVPSQGLDVSDLDIMLKGQPNKDALVNEISNESPFIDMLEEQFSGISHLRKMKLLWAYETKTTPTLTMVDGEYRRSGPGRVFVSPQSATGQRCTTDPASTIQINANHSDMVKFSQGNEAIDRIAYKLRDMLESDVAKPHGGVNNTAVEKTTALRGNHQRAESAMEHVDNSLDPEFWDTNSIIKSINAPERDLRLEQIDVAAGHSFQWAFENSSVGLTRWLQSEEELFWISGKPGSGKSTFLKYLHTNPLTSKYLRNWYHSTNHVQATFFFHHRGTAIQKSLEGLYRGILGQILEQAPQSLFVIHPSLSQTYAEVVRSHNLGTLSSDLAALVSSCEITQDDEVSRQLQHVLLCEMPRRAFRTMVMKPMQASGTIGEDTETLEQIFQHRHHFQTFTYATNIAHTDNKNRNAPTSLALWISKNLVFTQDITNQDKGGFVNVDLLISKNTRSIAKPTFKSNKRVFATLDLFISQKRVYTTDIIYDENKDILAEVEVFTSKTLRYSTTVAKNTFSASKSENEWPKGEQVASTIQDWLVAIDPVAQFSQLKTLLENRTKQHEHHQVDKSVKETLVRFFYRKEQQQRIEAAHWSLQQLSDAMDRVASQRLIDLDLCLLLDALDEHDGPPEVISHFIKKFTTAEKSRTRMKILFSSRPWQPFIDAFGQNSGFQIHDFTEDDIRELCLQKTISGKPGSAEVLELTEQIVKQARGVFLWVKLVLSDLLENAAKLAVSGYSTGQLHAALIDILNSLPNDLEQYYKLIITRIPSSYRWEAYCLLEVISKSADAIFLSQVSDILACARANSVDDLFALKARSRDAAHRYSNGELRTHSGGLIEAVGSNQLQLLHQTLIEFVQLPEFKNLILEDRYRITKENGYSILLKYTVFREDLLHQEYHNLHSPVVTVSSKALYYAREAESTTGESAFALFQHVVWEPPPEDNFLPKIGNLKYTTLEIAIAYGLKLLCNDVLRRDARVNPDRAPLVFLLLRNMVKGGRIDSAGALNTLQDMVAQGFPIHNSHIGFLTILTTLIDERPQIVMEGVASSIGATPVIAFCREVLDTLFEPNFSFVCHKGGLEVEEIDLFRMFLGMYGIKDTAQAIHISADDEMTRYLLENGANPNELTTERLTPIDCRIKDIPTNIFPRELGHIVSSITILVEHGGRLNVCTRKKWNKLVQWMSATTSISLPPFPGWLDGAPGASRGIDFDIRSVKRRSRNFMKLWKRG